MSCSGPIFACGREVQPPINRTGTRASDALAMAVTVLVTPGPAVTMATPKLARQFGVRMRHVHGGAFVADIDDADAEPRDMVPDRLDMAALQAEDAVDAARLQKARDPGCAGLFVGIQILGRGHGPIPLCARVLCARARLSGRCRRAGGAARGEEFFPVAVRGISSSRINDTERGRL